MSEAQPTPMATAKQIKSLIRSHFGDDDERFLTLALQVAAHEAQQGHGELAHDIKKIVDDARRTRGPNTLLKFPQELAGMVLLERADVPVSALVVTRRAEETNPTHHPRAPATGEAQDPRAFPSTKDPAGGPAGHRQDDDRARASA